MNIRNIGLGAGLISGAIALVVGLLLISAAESMEFVSGEGGGGLALLTQWIGYWLLYGLGVLIALAGALIASVVFVGWVFAEIYSSLSPQGKKKAQLGALVLLVFCTGPFIIHYYQQPPHETMDKRPIEKQTKAEAKTVINLAEQKSDKTIDRPGANNGALEQRAAARRLLVGQWERIDNPNYIIIFDEQGDVVSTEDGKLLLEANWSLSVGPTVVDKAFAFDIMVEKQDQSWWVIIRHLDSEKLVIHSHDENGTVYKRSSDTNEQDELQ